MGNFAVGDTRQNRVISIHGPPGLQGFEGPKGEPCLQGPKGDKGDFGSDGKTALWLLISGWLKVKSSI